MCGNPLDLVEDVGLNIVTGGLYSVGKAVAKTVDSGDPLDLLSQGLDIGAAAVGNQAAVDLFGRNAGLAYNAAGGLLGAAGAAGAFSNLPGFAPGGVAQTAGTTAGSLGSETAQLGAINDQMGTALSQTPGLGPGTTVGTGVTPSVTAPVLSAPTVAPTPVSGIPGSTAGPYDLSSSFGVNAVGDTAQAMHGMGAAQQAVANLPLNFGTNAAADLSWWAAQPEMVKAALLYGGISTGGQLVTGALGGMFEGVAAEKRLALEQLINSQRENQVQYLNKNNAYAPLLTFKPNAGVLDTAARRA